MACNYSYMKTYKTLYELVMVRSIVLVWKMLIPVEIVQELVYFILHFMMQTERTSFLFICNCTG